ncbi:MAG: hypothetical protein LBV10_09160 [Stenotrophomonas sp.]|jgi:hypothetical protein|uniref:hypothetical protein n=1 Tax=Stenotrophomonas sp. TaxID=69392 RepID=UPI002844ADBA|nr:hypothetical protein [Stenotrophomonas sp.]MDR2959702.1 hypothetical protein [Stenotrophomonas sp.]
MVDVKISALPNAAALAGTEVLPAFQAGNTVKVLVSAIRAGLVQNTGDEDVGGIKTFTGSQVRMSSASPGWWMNEVGGNFSLYVVLDADNLQFQVRPVGFGNSIVDMPFRIELGNKVITTDYLVRPRTTLKDDLGSGTFRYRDAFVRSINVNESVAFANATAVRNTKANLGLPITVSTTAPTSPAEGDIWIDIS